MYTVSMLPDNIGNLVATLHLRGRECFRTLQIIYLIPDFCAYRAEGDWTCRTTVLSKTRNAGMLHHAR